MANFNLDGKTPSFNDLFIIAVMGGLKNESNSLRIFEGMLKGPHALEVENLLISSATSISLHSYSTIFR